MSSTQHASLADAFSFDRTIAEVKQGMATASNAQTELSAKTSQASKDLLVFGQANLEAIVRAGQVYAAGMQDLSREMVGMGQTALKEALANMHALSAAKTPKAAFELQATVARSTAIHGITESARIAQSGVDLAERVSAPLVARMVAATDLITTART